MCITINIPMWGVFIVSAMLAVNSAISIWHWYAIRALDRARALSQTEKETV